MVIFKLRSFHSDSLALLKSHFNFNRRRRYRSLTSIVNFSKKALVFGLIFTWIFSGVPQFWNFPQEIPEARAATTAFRQEINIINHEFNAASGSYASSSAIIQIDTTKYTGATYYFEVVTAASSSLAYNVTLQNATSGAVNATISVPTGTTAYTRFRSASFTPNVTGEGYYRAVIGGATGAVKSVIAARVVILQSADPISSTRTQIEIGNEETGKTNTATAALSNPKYWKYDSTKWDGSPTFKVQASFKHTQTSSSTQYDVSATTTTTSYTYKGSIGVSYVQVEVWGAGGGGSIGNAGGGGGGGGAYARSTTTVSVGSSHTLSVGGGGARDTAGRAESSTYDTNVVVAEGGTATAANTAGDGGLAANSIGQVKFDGGNGGLGHTTGDVGGGGGGAGGPHGAGVAAAGAAADAPTAGGNGDASSGGAGGSAGTTNDDICSTASGKPGNNHANGAGGGGGAGSDSSGDCSGGAGGRPGGGGGSSEDATPENQEGGPGRIILTETHGMAGIALEEDDGSFGSWTLKVQISTSTIATSTSATTTAYSFNPTTGRHYRLVASSTASTATYDIYNAKIIVDQSSPTLLETQYLIANTGSFGGTTGLKDFDTYFDPAEWVNVGNTYIHQAEGVVAGTGDVKLQIGPNDVTVSDITGSTITDVIELEQSTSMTMPGSATTTDVNVTGTGTLNASRILVQVGPAPTTITVGGFVYSDEGTTALSACGGAGTELSVAVGTSTPGQFVGDCTSGTGAFTITLTDTASLTAGTPIIGYIDGVASTFGSAVRPSGTGSMTGLIIRQNRVVIDNNAAASTTDNGALSRWDNDNDTDVNFSSNSGTLILESGHKLIATGDDTFAPLGIASTTAGGASPGGDVQVDSGATLNMGTNDLRIGGDFMNFGTYIVGAGQITTFNGTRAGGNGFGFGNNGVNDFTFENLTIGGTVAITASSSFTVGSGDTLTVNPAGELALRSGKNATSSGTLTLNGTVSGSGVLAITDTSSGPGTAGTLNAPVKFYATDADIAPTVLDARTGAGGTGYGGLVEIFSGSGSARNAVFNSGTYDFNAGFNIISAAGGNVVLLATPNNPTVNISATNGLDFTGIGAGTEIIYAGSGTWTNSGNTDFSNGAYYASSTGIFAMDGTSKILTSNQQGFSDLRLTGSITTVGAATSTANLTLSGSTINLGSYASTTGNAILSGTVYPQEQAVILGGLDKTLTGGGIIGGLIIRGEYTLSGSDLTAGTSTIITGASTTVATGRILTSTSSLSVVGTLDGNGTTSIQHSNLTGTANPNSHIQFSATTTTITMPQKTYGGNVEIFNGLPGAGIVQTAAGTHILNGPAGLYLKSTNGAITLDGSTNSSAATIAGDLSCASGGGTKTISTGSTANTWAISGNVDFTNCTYTAGLGNTLTMNGTSKTLTSNAQTLNNFTVSGGSVSLSGDVTVSGDLTKSGGTFADNGRLITLSGTSKNIDLSGAAQTLHNLRISGTYSVINNDLTISTTTIDTAKSLTVGTGRTLIATSTLTLQGTGLITGAGTTTFGNATYACSNLSTIQGTGLLSPNVRADATSGDCTLSARVFGQNLEIYSNSASNRVVTFSTGSSTVSSDLLLNANSTGDITATSTSGTELKITRNLDYAGTGGGNEIINHNQAVWRASGNADFTNGVFTAPTASSTWIMDGSSKTLTAAAPFDNLDLAGSITLASNASSTGDVTLSGTLTPGGNTVNLISTDAENIVGGGNTIHSLWVRGPYTLTGSDLTVSTSTIDTDQSLTVGASRILIATSTLTLQGTGLITGAGTTTFGNTSYACSNLNTIQGTGLLSTNVRADLTGGNCTLPARVYGSNLEIFSNSGSARTATLTTGSSTVSGALLMNVIGGANTTLASVATTEMHVTGNLDLLTASGKEIFDHTNSVWQVSGDANFSGGGFVEPTASSTFIMNGSSKTLTAAGSFSNLDLANSITFGSNASSTGNVRLANSVVSGSNTMFMNGADKTLNITGGSLSINNLNIISGASTTISTNNLTVSDTLTVAGAMQVTSPRVVTSGNNESSDTLTLTGTIHGTGTTTLASSTLGTTGIFNSNVRFDISSASSTMPARTYNGNVEVYHSNATSRGLLMAAGTHTLNSALILRTDGTGNGTLDGGSNNSTPSVSGASIYIGAGSGREIMTAGSNNFTFSSALNISGGTFKTSSATTSVAGNYTNNDGLLTALSGVFLLNGTSQQTFTGIATGSSAFYDLTITNISGGGNATDSPSVIFANVASTTNTLFVTTANVTARFPAAGTSTFQNINWNGQGAGTEFKPRSSISGDRWAFRVPGNRYNVSRVDFMDADECDEGNNIDASTGNNINSGNNNCIDFSATAVSIVSAANQVFEKGQATTSISQITVTAGSGSGLITAGSDLRIAIATTTTVLSPAPSTAVAMHWDYDDTTAAISGSPQTCTVGTGVSYEGSNSVLVVPISGSNCAAGDQIIISGLSFAGFDAVNASATALYLLLNGATDVTANASNTAQYVAIKGSQTLANHTAGQESNKLDITQVTVDDVEMFAFRLTPNYEGASTTQIVVSLSNMKGFSCASLNNLSGEGLYIDYNSNGNIDAGETATGTPSCSINASAGTGSLTFDLTYATSVARDFIVRADVSNNNPENKIGLTLSGSNVTSRGTTSIQSLTTSGTASQVNQFRGSAQSAGANIQPLPPGEETPRGGGTGQDAGGGLDGGGAPGGSSGGGSGQSGGGDLPYVPSLLRPLASILFGFMNLIALLK